MKDENVEWTSSSPDHCAREPLYARIDVDSPNQMPSRSLPCGVSGISPTLKFESSFRNR